MKLETKQFNALLLGDVLHISTDGKIKVNVDGKVVGPIISKPKKGDWVLVEEGKIMKGDRVTNGDYVDLAKGLVGWTIRRASKEGWKVHRKFQSS